MIDFELIREQSKAAGACIGNYKAYCIALKNNNLTEAAQVILGNYKWIKRNIIYTIPYSELEEQAECIGISFYSSGHIYRYCTYKNRKLHGVSTVYYPDGQIWKHCIYENGEEQ